MTRVLRLVLAIGCWGAAASAQTVGGTTGLLSVPTAAMPTDGEVAVGMGVLHRRHQDYRGGEYHLLTTTLQLGFTPFLEIGLRLTRAIGFPEPQALGDRMLSVRVRVLREGRAAPAVAVGVHDPITSSAVQTNHFNALYLVASKTLPGPGGARAVGLHLGYGSDAMRARHHTFVGPFGGVAVRPTPGVEGLLEFDGRGLNGGLRLRPHRSLTVTAGLDRFAVPTAGVRVQTRLPH